MDGVVEELVLVEAAVRRKRTLVFWEDGGFICLIDLEMIEEMKVGE